MTMAGTSMRVRFVKCPKCFKVLIEVPHVSVYMCGGCGTILRAKQRDDNRGNASSGSPNSNLNSRSQDGLLGNNELAFSTEQKISRPSDVGNGPGKAGTPNLQLPDLSALSNSQEKLESSKHKENGIEDTRTINSRAQRQSSEVTQGKAEKYQNEELEKSPKISQQYHRNLSSSKRMHEVEDYTPGVGLKEDKEENNLRSSINGTSSAHVVGVEKRVEDLYCPNDMAARIDVNKTESSHGRWNLAPKRITSLDSEAFHSVHSWMEPENDGHSRSLLKDSVFHGDSFKYQNGIPSPKFRYLKRDQMEVLRLVDELRDQLNGLFGQTVKARRRHHVRSTHQEGQRRHHVRSTHQEGQQPLLHSCKSKLQATRCLNSNLFDRSPRACPYNKACACCVCLHCHHGLCGAYPKIACCHLSKDPCVSCHEAQPLDHHLGKLQQEERRKPAKHHCRPVCGGAPFVTCYKCFELLQMPADFLISRKGLHKLQCSACSEVLEFSFRARPPIIPQTPTEVQHPPSEVSAAHSNSDPREDPVSFTEDGPSFDRSYSMETKVHKLPASRDSPESVDERRRKRVASSSLHRLMGYSSARELMSRPLDAEECYNSKQATALYCNRPSEKVIRSLV